MRGLVKTMMFAAVSVLAFAGAASAGTKWVASGGGSCAKACGGAGMQAVTSGNYKNGKPFFVCAVNAHGEGLRPGYNLEPDWAKGCVVGWGSKEETIAAGASCLCAGKCDAKSIPTMASDLRDMHLKYNTLTHNNQAGEKQALKAKIVAATDKMNKIVEACQ